MKLYMILWNWWFIKEMKWNLIDYSWRISLDSIPKSCVSNAPKTTLYVDPKEAILRIEKLEERKEIHFTKCDTFSQTIKISNLGFGHAANIRINFNIPAGVNLNLIELRFPFRSTTSKTIPFQYDPIKTNYFTEISNTEFGKNFATIYPDIIRLYGY